MTLGEKVVYLGSLQQTAQDMNQNRLVPHNRRFLVRIGTTRSTSRLELPEWAHPTFDTSCVRRLSVHQDDDNTMW